MIENSTLLLLGASTDQLFAIRTAKAMGLRVLAVDMNPNSPGFRLADDYAIISTRNTPFLKTYLDDYQGRGHHVAGVMVMGSDIPQVIAELAEHLGTPGLSRETARLASHKYEMKCRFRERGVPVPWFCRVDTVEELRSVAAERGFPLILKPVDRSGARGVYFLTRHSILEELFEKSRNLSFAREVMVEEYLSGPQISTESIMYDGRAYTPGLADRNYEKLATYAPNIIENGGWVPSSVTPSQRQEIESLVERAALALGVSEGVVKGDVVLTAQGPVMIEMAARLSGGDFSESLIPLGCGINIVEAAIQIAIGEKPDFSRLVPRWEKGVVNRYFFPAPGRLIRIDGVEEAEKQPWLRKLEFWYQKGELVPPVQSHADRFGVFIATGENREQAVERAQWVYDTIQIVTEPG